MVALRLILLVALTMMVASWECVDTFRQGFLSFVILGLVLSLPASVPA